MKNLFKHMNRKILPVFMAVAILIGAVPFGTLTAVAASESDAKDKAISYISLTVTNPDTGTFGGDWSVLAQAVDGKNTAQYYDGYYKNVVNYVQGIGSGKLDNNKSTDNSRIILALSSIDKDARSVGGYDLVAPYADFEWIVNQGINGAVYALLALDSGNYPIPYDENAAEQATRSKLVEYILSGEIDGGGWNFFGDTPDPDCTALVIQALALYRDDETVVSALERALDKLSEIQLSDGGFSSWGMENSGSSAQVIIALAALEINPIEDSHFVKDGGNPISALLEYQLDNGAFEYMPGMGGDGMATDQAALALVAYDRLLKGESALYNMANLTTPPADDKAPDEDETEADTTQADEIGKDNDDNQNSSNNSQESNESMSNSNNSTQDNGNINETPQTGDNSAPYALSVIALASLSVLFMLISKKETGYLNEFFKRVWKLKQARIGLTVVCITAILAAAFFFAPDGGKQSGNAPGNTLDSTCSEESTTSSETGYILSTAETEKEDESANVQVSSETGEDTKDDYTGSRGQSENETGSSVDNELSNDTEQQNKSTAASSEIKNPSNAASSAVSESKSVVSDDKCQTGSIPESEPAPQETKAVTSDEGNKLTCTISIRCDTILDNIDLLKKGKESIIPKDGTILAVTSVRFSEGESVFDVLKRITTEKRIHMEAEYTPIYNSAYIEGIANIYEFDCGGLSGWRYKVNDVLEGYGCSSYVLKDGDKIEWVYTCDLGADVDGRIAAGQSQ